MGLKRIPVIEHNLIPMRIFTSLSGHVKQLNLNHSVKGVRCL
jgi:hypothetical protein